VEYDGGSLESAIEYTSGILRPHQAITFTASGPPPEVAERAQAEATQAEGTQTGATQTGATQYEWLFGDGTRAIGPRVRHSFPDTAGTLRDGSGRFRVLLRATDAAGHSAWTERSIVVASSVAPPIVPSSPPRPGLLEPGLVEAGFVDSGLRTKNERGEGEVLLQEASATHMSDTLAAAPVGSTLHFNGYLDVPSDGGYTFSVLASGHTTLTMDGRILARSPKQRALVCGMLGYATQAAVGSMVLRRGLHRFDLSAERAPGESTLALKWEGPGILLSDVPDAAFRHALISGRQ